MESILFHFYNIELGCPKTSCIMKNNLRWTDQIDYAIIFLQTVEQYPNISSNIK